MPSAPAGAAASKSQRGWWLDVTSSTLHPLEYYERTLGTSHPGYLAQLCVYQANARGEIDKAVFTLTVVSMTVVSIQVVLGKTHTLCRHS